MLEQPVDRVLDRRRHPELRRQRMAATAVSVVLHVTLIALFVIAPALAARRQEPIEFVPVRIVPVEALGRPDAPPPKPKPEPPRPAAPEPEPETPKTKPKPKQAVVPDPAPRSPAPSQRSSAPTEPAAADDTPPARRGSLTGSATGTSPFGGAVAGLDSPDFVYNYYVEQMLALIGAHWVRPPSTAGVEAIIHFRIARQGDLNSLELVQPSGISAFDLAGLRAVREAAPLPPLPRSFPHDSLGVRLVIR